VNTSSSQASRSTSTSIIRRLLGNALPKVIAKRGDFHGISENGTIRGLLFPASPAFSPDEKFLYVSNIALYLPFAGVPEPAIDSPWTLKVKHYTIAKSRAVVPPLSDRDDPEDQ